MTIQDCVVVYDGIDASTGKPFDMEAWQRSVDLRRQQAQRSWPPTEKTLEWCRRHIPHFETCERQVRAAGRGEAA